VLQSCFFALKDTVTPAKTSFLSLVLNVVFIAILMFPLKIAGLALATTISGIITFFVLFSKLQKKLHPFNTDEIISSLGRILIASVFMGIICYMLSCPQMPFITSFGKIIRLCLLLASGLFFYILFCFIFRVREMHEFISWLKSRKKQEIPA